MRQYKAMYCTTYIHMYQEFCKNTFTVYNKDAYRMGFRSKTLILKGDCMTRMGTTQSEHTLQLLIGIQNKQKYIKVEAKHKSSKLWLCL